MVLWRQLVAISLRIQLSVPRTFVDIHIGRLKSSQFVRQKSKMVEENGPIAFNSRSKPPYDKFSNFYEVELKMPEGVFGSVEHYFQAMKFVDKNHQRFEINGDLGKRRIDKDSWKVTVSRGRFIKSAGGKTGTQKHKLTLRSNGLDRGRGKQKMKEGLQKKFECDPFKTLLLETGKRKLVHIPMRGKTDYWTGRVDKTSGDINGENTMGKLLMEVRHELQEVEKCTRVAEEIDIGATEDEDENKFVEESSKAGGDIKDGSDGDDDSKEAEKGDGDSKEAEKGDDDSKEAEKGGDDSKEAEKGDDDSKGAGKGDDDSKEAEKGDDDSKEAGKGDDVSTDEEKGDVVMKDGNKGTGDIKDDGQKGGDENTSDSKSNLTNKGTKRKHEDNDPQVETLDQEVSKARKLKRKKN